MSSNPPPIYRESEPRVLWSGRFIEALKWGPWEYVRRLGVSGAVGIVAVTDERELVVIRQYRPPVKGHVWEIPAGLAGDIVGQEAEEMVAAARRELLEEAGYQASHWRLLFEGVSSAGLADESVTLFLATGLRKVGEGGGDDHEEIEVHTVPLTRFDAWIAHATRDGDRVDLKVHLAAAVAREHVAKLG